MSMETIIVRGADQPPHRFGCKVCHDLDLVLPDVDSARMHVEMFPGHVVMITSLRVDLMVAGHNIWHISPYTMTEAAEGPSEG